MSVKSFMTRKENGEGLWMGSDRNRSGICSGHVYDKLGSRDRIYCSGSYDHYNCTGILSESKM